MDKVGIIPQLTSDPVSPAGEDAWVLATIGGGSGGGTLKAFSGLGFPIISPNTGGTQLYQLSYQTKEGTTKRVNLT